MVDNIYITRHLKRYSRKDYDVVISKNVQEYLNAKNYKDYIKKGIGNRQLLKYSKQQVDRFEYELAKIIN